MSQLLFSRSVLSRVLLGCFVLFFIWSFASPVFAWSFGSPIVPNCDGSVTDSENSVGTQGHLLAGCGYKAFLMLISNVIQFLLYIAVPIAAISFFFAGFLYLTAGGNTGKIEEAHQIFWSALIGIIIMLSAWLLVNTIVKGLVSDQSFFQGIF